VKNLGVDADAVVIQNQRGAAGPQDEGRQDVCERGSGAEEVARNLTFVVPA